MVPDSDRPKADCAYMPCLERATIAVRTRHGMISVCHTHYERWVREGMEHGPGFDWERCAREVALRFNVNPDLPPKARAMALWKAVFGHAG